MTYLQIEYFLSVAKTKSVTQSAAELFVSAPAVSKQISALERELGFPLFERTPQGMGLTAPGEAMHQHFFSQHLAYELALQRTRSLQAARENVLHLGIMEGWNLTEQMHQLKQLMLSLPTQTRLVLHYYKLGTKDLLDHSELDALIWLDDDVVEGRRRADCTVEHLTDIRKVFLFSALHPLASKPDLAPADFAGLPLITFAPEVSSSAQQRNFALCSALGFEPAMLVTDTLESALLRVGLGDGFLIGDEWLEKAYLPGYAALPLDNTHRISLVRWNRGARPSLDALAEVCREHIRWPGVGNSN